MNESEEFVKMEPGAGNFGECLVEGNAEDKRRGRKIKRRAIAISVALQSLGLTVLVIAPMVAKPPDLTVRTMMPIPPYNPPHTPHVASDPIPPINNHHVCVVCPTAPIAPIDHSFTHADAPPDNGPEVPGAGAASPSSGLVPEIFDSRTQPRKPEEVPDKKRVVIGHIDPALLVNRVEPVFPPLLRQLRRNAKVELRAVIATDGTVQSLQVVSGDPLCVQSALNAVRQWRYKPTLLNGQPVEVDTFITVIYTVNQQ